MAYIHSASFGTLQVGDDIHELAIDLQHEIEFMAFKFRCYKIAQTFKIRNNRRAMMMVISLKNISIKHERTASRRRNLSCFIQSTTLARQFKFP